MRCVTTLVSSGRGRNVITSPTSRSSASFGTTRSTTTWLPTGSVGSMDPERTVSGIQPLNLGTATTERTTARQPRPKIQIRTRTHRRTHPLPDHSELTGDQTERDAGREGEVTYG